MTGCKTSPYCKPLKRLWLFTKKPWWAGDMLFFTNLKVIVNPCYFVAARIPWLQVLKNFWTAALLDESWRQEGGWILVFDRYLKEKYASPFKLLPLRLLWPKKTLKGWERGAQNQNSVKHMTNTQNVAFWGIQRTQLGQRRNLRWDHAR